MVYGYTQDVITLIDLIFPRRCVGCGKFGQYICLNCKKSIQFLDQKCPECDRPAIDGLTHPVCKRPYGLDGLVTVFGNHGVIKKAIKQLKYRFISDMAESLIKLVPPSFYQNLSYLSNDTVIYPIPLHRDRLKWRGFNQAEKLAIFIAKELRLPLVDGLLTRKEKRTPQADIEHREDRIKNAQGLFSMYPMHPIYPNILLFDDVWTTGATIKEATKVLKRGGVEKVWAMTIAR